MKGKAWLLLVFVSVIVIGVLFRTQERFTSPGTMVQLATSHVPTQEDVDYYRKIYPKMVRHDLIDLTGEDPGPISVPYPQLWF
jgi:hypothetical protein